MPNNMNVIVLPARFSLLWLLSPFFWLSRSLSQQLLEPASLVTLLLTTLRFPQHAVKQVGILIVLASIGGTIFILNVWCVLHFKHVFERLFTWDHAFLPTVCISQNTFGTNSAGSLQGWYNDIGDQLDFTLRRGSTSSSLTGPSADHTTGSGKFRYSLIAINVFFANVEPFHADPASSVGW